MNRPWMQFNTRDWLDNKELRRCSAEARAVLADLMCMAHEGTPYGFLCDDIGPLSDAYMASRCVLPVARFRKCLLELARNERITQKSGSFFIQRMVTDEETRQKRAAGGVLGGNPSLGKKVNLMDNLDVKHQGYPPSRVRTDTRSDSSSISGSVVDFDLDFFEGIWKRWKRQRRDQPMQVVIQSVSGRDSFNWSEFKANAPPYIAWCEAMKPEPWKYASLTLWEWIEGGMILPPEAKSEPDWMDGI